MNAKKICSLILISVFSITAFAQDADTSSKKVSLSTVIISANKMEEPYNTVAQQVELISSKQIEQMAAPTMAEVLQSSGYVNVQKSQQGGGSPVIRGFEASRVLLVVDGVRMNNLIYRSGHLQNVITVDQQILERVEVLFGPSSTVYGSDALGGVVHMMTKQPKFNSTDKNLFVSGNSLVRYATANKEKTGHVDFNIGTKKFASLTSFTYSDFDDLKMGKQKGVIDSVFGKRYYYVKRFGDKDSLVLNDDPYLQRYSGYRQYDALQKFSFRQSEHVTHTLNLQLSNSTDIPRYDRLTDKGSGGNGLRWAEWYYGPQLRSLSAYELNLTGMTGTFNRMSAGISHQYIEESRHQRRFNSNNLDNRIEKVNVMGYHLDVYRIKAEHQLRMGLDGQYNTVKSTAFRRNIVTNAEMPLDTRYPDGDNIMQHHAIYATHTWHINPKWVVNDGFRFQYSNLKSEFVNKDFFPFPFNKAEQKNTAVTGNAGIIFIPEPSWKISMMLSSGFRVPNVDDLGKVFESTAGKIIVPNAAIKPERTYNADLGISKVFMDKIKWENNAFYTLYRNAIVLDKFTFNGNDSIDYNGTLSAVFANQNKRKAFITGFSSILMADISNHFSFFASVTYTYARIQTDTGHVPLDHIPPVYGRTEVSYTCGHLRINLSADYNGWKKLKDYYLNSEDNEQYATPEGMPAWYVFNLGASYQFTRNWQLQTGCNNLLDTQYRPFASGINAAGRSIFAALKFTW